MSSWRQQALIEAPVERVWRMVGDPARYPEWASYVIEVTGLPSIERDATFTQLSKTLLGSRETTFRIEELDELHEIKLRCLETGYFSRWILTAARENTFAEVEIGVEPTSLRYRLADATVGKRWYRRLVDEAIDGIRAAAERPGSRPAEP